MHEDSFCNSFQPPPPKIFGVTLTIFTIGHEIALIRQGNPLVIYNESSIAELSDEAMRLALIMTVEICGKIGLFSKLLFAIKASRSPKIKLAEEMKKLRAYLADGSLDMPLAKMPRQHGVPFHYFGAPELARVLNYVAGQHSLLIAAHFHGSPLNMPLGLARMLYSTHLESQGEIWVKNHQDMERERPRREGTPAVGANEKVLTGEEAEKAFAEVMAKATGGKN